MSLFQADVFGNCCVEYEVIEMMTQLLRKERESVRWGPLVGILGLLLAAGPGAAQGDA